MYYLSMVILPLALIFLWLYLILIFKNNFPISHTTSIELNIIDKIKNSEHQTHELQTNNSEQSDLNYGKPFEKRKKKYHVPKFMLELYEKNKGIGRHNVRPDVVRGLIPKHAGTLQDNEILEELSKNHLLVFDLPNSNQDEQFIGAELKILTQVDIDPVGVDTGVKKTVKISVYDEFSKQFLFLKELQIHHFNNTWLSFDLTLPVMKILHNNYQDKYLKVIITLSSYFHHLKNHQNDKMKLSLMPEFENFEHDYPILLMSYSSNAVNQNKFSNASEEDVRKRSKRNTEDDYEEETNKIWDEEFGSNKKVPKKILKRVRNTCRKKPLYINFSEIDYDIWIVQPTGYEAYQCQGRCFFPVAEHLNPTKHAVMQALVHSVFPSRASRSCCVPTALDSISILYVDEKGVLTYRYAYNDMVVVECGCR